MDNLSYHNDEGLKDAFVKEIETHRRLDAFIQGTYDDGYVGVFKGCSVGCSIHSMNRIQGTSINYEDHAALAEAVGWPEWLVRLQDTLFEGMSEEDSKNWTLSLANAVPVGKDINPVKWRFCSYLMQGNIERVENLDINEALKAKVITAIEQCKELHDNAIKTGQWDESAVRSSAESLWSAAWSAAESAESAARSAWSAAESSVWSAAWSAARSAAWSAEWSAAESAEFKRHSCMLIKLLVRV